VAAKFFAELRRRNVFRAAAFYAASAWLLVQVATQVFPLFHVAEWVLRAIVIAAVIGFPFALLFAWFYEWTPQGFQRENEVTATESVSRRTGRKLDRWITIILSLAVVLLLTDRLVLRRSATDNVAAEKSIAVLPFENESGDLEMEFLSDGIAEALINSLAELPQLRVIARSTAFRYKNRDVDPREVGRALKVQSLLMGKVKQVGDRLHMQVDLVNAATGAQLWGATYERNLAEVVNVKQAIAREITGTLRLKLSGQQQQQLTRRDPTNSEAYPFYLRGRFYWNKRTAENIQKAIAEFQQAIERDPGFALGYVGLADSYIVLSQYAGRPQTETIPQAKMAVERALQIDDSMAEAHASLGTIYHNTWRWLEAEQEFQRATSLNPNYATGHHWFANHLLIIGQLERALAEIKRAQELDPLAPIGHTTMAAIYLAKNDPTSAREECRKMLELEPNFPSGHLFLGWSYFQQQNSAEGIRSFEKAVETSGRAAYYLAALGYGQAFAGRRAEASAILQELEEKHRRREALALYVAAVHVGLGDKEAAFAWLERAFEERSHLPSILTESAFVSLRGEPRYADLLRRMGLLR
jgi:serine/threonine-protein kinase